MKIRTLFLSFAILLLAGPTVFAKSVSKEEARKIAYNFFAQNIVNKLSNWSLDELNIVDVTTRNADEVPMFYVFSNNGRGFILVSADDVFTPVLGFSYEDNFPEKGKVEQLDYILGDYQKEFEYAKTNNLTALDIVSQKWDTYRQGYSNAKSVEATDTLGPLLVSLWNQDYPYNAYAPADPAGPGGHTYAGCVATAMSQIMYFYRWPKTGNGQSSYSHPVYGILSANYGATSYDWDGMRNEITATNGGNSIPAIAELQYHCGVSVKMDYDPDGSGAVSNEVPVAIRNYFRYSTSANFVQRNSTPWATWETTLITELDQLRPIYYSGRDGSGQNGHAWVCDGYTTSAGTKYFHHNFGWGGSGNGFYIVSAPTGGGLSFTTGHGIVKNFVPVNYTPSYASRTLTAINGSFQSGNLARQPYDPNLNCEYLIAPVDSVKNLKITFPYFDVDPSDIVRVYDGENASAPLLGSFNESTPPSATISTTSNRAFVVFITDAANEKTGWQVEYTGTLPTFCSGLKSLTGANGVIDDGSGPARYNNNANCRWKIVPAGDMMNVKLEFESFDLAPGDSLEIRSFKTNQVIAKVSGSNIPGPYTEAKGGFLLTFTSSQWGPAQGFKINYSSEIDAVKKHDEITGMSVYPNPSSGNFTLEFTNLKGKDYSIRVADLAGKTLYNEKVSGITGEVIRPLDLSSLRSGMYILTLSTNQSSSSQKIIIK